jgi:hypothetical protein
MLSLKAAISLSVYGEACITPSSPSMLASKPNGRTFQPRTARLSGVALWHQQPHAGGGDTHEAVGNDSCT